MSATDCQFDYKQYQRMFHPKLPEICVYVSQSKRISEYELQRMFRVSKADVPYIYHALLLMGVIELVEGEIDYSVVLDEGNDLPSFEIKVLGLIDFSKDYFGRKIMEEERVERIAEEVARYDPLIEEAIKFVVEERRASVSGIQRKFRIGYNRAARIIEEMELLKIISTSDRNGSRMVLVDRDYQYQKE